MSRTSPFLDRVRERFRPELWERGTPRLREEQANADPTIISLEKSRDEDVVTLRPDEVRRIATPPERVLFPFLDPKQEGLTACSDYIVFAHDISRAAAPLFVLLVELKSRNATSARRQAPRQIRNACLLARHLLNLTAYHGAIALPERRFRGVVFSRAVSASTYDPRRPIRYSPPEDLVGAPLAIAQVGLPAATAGEARYLLSRFCS